MTIKLGVIKERREGDPRVSINLAAATKLVKSGYSLIFEKNAGIGSKITDADYKKISKKITFETGAEVIKKSDIIISINPLSEKDAGGIKENAIYISHIFAHKNLGLVKTLNRKKVTSIAMELIPRITRAQAMDSLSSQAAIAGYKATLRAAELSPIFFPMLTYAAGTIRPAKVLVIGTGVAGLQAIATAKRLGAIVEAYDIRPETREQVESLGAKFVDVAIDARGEGGYARSLTSEELKQQSDILAAHIAKANIIITTAAIPGKPSPKIINKNMIAAMQRGSVIVDIAAENGGNTDLTKKDDINITKNGVTIAGLVNISAQMPVDASEMYSKNISNILPLLSNGKEITIDVKDEIISGALLTYNGETVHAQFKAKKATTKRKPTEKKAVTKKAVAKKVVTKKTTVAKKTTAVKKPKDKQEVTNSKKQVSQKSVTNSAKKQSNATVKLEKDSSKVSVAQKKRRGKATTIAAPNRKKIDGKDEVVTGSASLWLQGKKQPE